MISLKSLSGWPKESMLFWNLHDFIKKGGPTPEERAELVRVFGVSEDLLLRYERVAIVYLPSIPEREDKQKRQASSEAARWMKKVGKDMLTDNADFWEKRREVHERILAEAPEDEIAREYEAAKAAVIAAVKASTSPPEK